MPLLIFEYSDQLLFLEANITKRAKRFRLNGAYSLARADDDRFIAFVRRGVVVADLRNRVHLWKGLPVTTPASASFSPDGRLLAVKSTSGWICVVDSATGSLVSDFGNHTEGEGSSVHFSSDGGSLVDGSWGGVLTVRRCSDGAIIFRRSDPGTMVTAISRDLQRGKWLIQYDRKVPEGQAGPLPSYFRLFEWPFKGDSGRIYECGVRASTSALSPDGSKVAFVFGYRERRIRVVDIASGLVSVTSDILSRGGMFKDIAWSVDGNRLVSLDAEGFSIYRSHDLVMIGSIAAEYPTCALFMGSGGQLLLATTSVTRSYEVNEWNAD